MSGSLGPTAPPTIFTDKAAALAEIRRDRFLSVGVNLFPAAQLSDDYLWFKLMSAEAQASRALRVFLTPRQCYATDTSPDRLGPLQDNGLPMFEEPGYDFDPDMFSGVNWTAITTRQRPIISIQSVVFYYPVPQNLFFEVPSTWLRPDKKYGRIDFVPLGLTLSGQVGSYVASTLGMQQMPLMIQIAYQAGLSNVWADYPDIPDVVKKMAVLSIIEDQFLPQSASTSGDGLSQSMSFDASKLQDQVDTKLDRLRRSIQGIVLGVM